MNPRRKLDRSFSGYDESFQSPQYKKFSAFEYDLNFQHFTIKKYLEKIRRIQSLENENFFPNEESYVRSYFNNTSQNFNINKIRYRNNTNLDIISSILANIVKSGSVFIKSTESLDYINKPVLFEIPILVDKKKLLINSIKLISLCCIKYSFKGNPNERKNRDANPCLVI